MGKKIPIYIQKGLDGVAKQYSDSPHTTNAGAVLRFLARFISVETIIKLFAHKLC